MASLLRIVRYPLVGVAAVLWLLLIPTVASAAAVAWDGGAETSNWSTPANWSGNAVPTMADDVTIGAGRSVVVGSGEGATIASLRVAGSLTLEPSAVGTGAAYLHVVGGIELEAGANVAVNGHLDSGSGQTTIASGASMSSSGTLDVIDLRNEGLLAANYNHVFVRDLLESTGILTGAGSIHTERYVDSGVTSLTGSIDTDDGTLSGTHSFCSLRGSWVQAAGTVTIPRLCTSEVASYRLDAGARLRVAVHAALGTPPPAYQHQPPLTASALQLDGTVEVVGAWGSDVTTSIRQGTLLSGVTRTGTPTIEVPTSLADGPGPWTFGASFAPGSSDLRFTVTETAPPTAPSNPRRLAGLSQLRAAWDPATDAETSVSGYSFAITTDADTVPDATPDISQPEIEQYMEAGTWHLHVRAIDAAGNAGPTIHAGPWEVVERGIWTGTGPTSSWHEPLNWELGVVPEAGADVYVVAAPGPTITAADVVVGRLTISEAVTLGIGRRLTALSAQLVGDADLLGGTLETPDLDVENLNGTPAMSSSVEGLTGLRVSGSTVRIGGSIDGAVVAEASAAVTVAGALHSNSISIDASSELTAGDVNLGPDGRLDVQGMLRANDVVVPSGAEIEVDGTLLADHLVSAGGIRGDGTLRASDVVSSGSLTVGEGASLDMGAFRQGPVTGAHILIPWSVSVAADTFQIDGGTADVGSPITGDVTLAGGETTFRFEDPTPDVMIIGSLTVAPGAKMAVPVQWQRLFEVTGSAQLNGSLTFEGPVYARWADFLRVLRATGGITGTPSVSVEPYDVEVRGTDLGVILRDVAPPATPVVSGALGATAPDGQRSVAMSWTRPADDVSGVAGYAVLVDSQPTSTPAAMQTHDASAMSASQLLAPGAWYVHVRARDASGSWGAAGHAGPFVVEQLPAERTPVALTPPVELDRCANIPGIQAVVPLHTTVRTDGSCWTSPSARADVLWGSGRGEVFSSGAGNDVIRAGAGPDRVNGGPGNDRLFGEAGDDRLVGGAGRDRLEGGMGRDVLDARDGAGGDVVACGPGRDVAYLDRGDRAARDCERRVVSRAVLAGDAR